MMIIPAKTFSSVLSVPIRFPRRVGASADVAFTKQRPYRGALKGFVQFYVARIKFDGEKESSVGSIILQAAYVWLLYLFSIGATRDSRRLIAEHLSLDEEVEPSKRYLQKAGKDTQDCTNEHEIGRGRTHRCMYCRTITIAYLNILPICILTSSSTCW